MTPPRFEINFLSEAGDIAFHLKPRFSSATVVGNTFQGGRWGQEEVSSVFPLVLGEPFEVMRAGEGRPLRVGWLRGTCGGVRAILPLCGKDAVSPALLCGFSGKGQPKASLLGAGGHTPQREGGDLWLGLRPPIWGRPA